MAATLNVKLEAPVKPNAVAFSTSFVATVFKRRATKILTTSSTLMSLLLATATTARATDSYNDGWIAHVADHQLEICYKATPPAVGQTVQILRTSFITPNKGPVREQFTPGGTARIVTAATSKGCLTAELIEGSAKRSDHARGDAAATPPSRS